jgi:hypothetical protein
METAHRTLWRLSHWGPQPRQIGTERRLCIHLAISDLGVGFDPEAAAIPTIFRQITAAAALLNHWTL